MNDDNDRGFWWGDTTHTNAQGAMALTTQGRLTVAEGIRVGYGETDTTIPSAGLAVNGTITSGAITSTGNSMFTGSGSTGDAFRVNRGSNGNAAFRVLNTGEVLIDSNYLYVTAAAGAYFSNSARFRGGITNDTGDLTLADDVVVTGTLSSGAIDSSGTSNFDSIQLTDASRLGFGTVKAGASIAHTASVDEGIFWHSSSDYGIYRTAGAWSGNYQQLKLKWHTGIEIDGHGTTFGKSGINFLNGNIKMDGTQILDASRNLLNIGTITTSGAIDLTGAGDTGSAGDVHLPRGGHITFYGNNSTNHSIGSRSSSGAITDDLRISSYGALYIDLDSNNNNDAGADFVIGRHGGGTGTMSNLFSVSGETGAVISNSNITAYGSASDIRLKENIETIEDSVEKVKKLRGVTFNYKKDGSKSTGLIAQELEKVLPEVVYETHDLHDEEDKYKAVRYGNIVGLLVEAIKDQQKQIDELKQRLDNDSSN